ncbi:hypothetical protein ACJJTC_002093 [Scirpophaga incertulas]
MNQQRALRPFSQLNWSYSTINLRINQMVCEMEGNEVQDTELQLASGKRKPGGQYLRYGDVLKRHLTAISMSSESWEELSTKRTEWRTAVKTGLENFESTRLEELDSKRQHRKTRPKPSYDYTYDSNGNLYCASCDRTFKSKFGFASHARAHARRDQVMS